MNYHLYSPSRFERSYSLDRINYESPTGRRVFDLSRNLLEDYDNTRGRTGRADSIVINNLNRALSASPGNISAKEHIPTHSTFSHRRVRRYSFGSDSDLLPTSNLKAHDPPKYNYILDPYNYGVRGNYLYYDDNLSVYPNYYRTYDPVYYPRYYNYFNTQGYYPQYYSRQRSIYPLSRLPESQYYYRYNVLPYYGYDANDMLRERRRKINSRLGYYSDFYAPSYGFFSNMRNSLSNIHSKMDSHKILLDRYTGIDMAPTSTNVGDSILEKSMQMSYRKRY